MFSNRLVLVTTVMNLSNTKRKPEIDICLLRLPQIKSEAGRKMSYYQGAYIFNSLSAKIREEKSLVLFRNLVNEFEFKT